MHGRGLTGRTGGGCEIALRATTTSSPGSTLRINSAPTTSNATVSLAKIDGIADRPITSGRMPSGSRQAIMPSGVMQISE
jgi:hypothetical protein